MSSTHIPTTRASAGCRRGSDPHARRHNADQSVTSAQATPADRRTARVGERVELARYAVSSGECVLYGQRVDGVVRVTDVPATGRGRAFVVERELERDGNAALTALIADYVRQARRLDEIPMSESVVARYLGAIES